MINIDNYEKYLADIIGENKIDTAIIGDTNGSTYIIVSGDKNVEQPQDFKIIKASHQGGTLVLFPEDIFFTWISSENKLPGILMDVFSFLTNHGLPIRIDNNDICLKDKKLFGTMSYEIKPDMWYGGMFFSFKPNISIIRQICDKPMVKIPNGLPDHITPDMIRKLCESLCEKYNLKLYGGDQ